jgi:hypothetical protein
MRWTNGWPERKWTWKGEKKNGKEETRNKSVVFVNKETGSPQTTGINTRHNVTGSVLIRRILTSAASSI